MRYLLRISVFVLIATSTYMAIFAQTQLSAKLVEEITLTPFTAQFAGNLPLASTIACWLFIGLPAACILFYSFGTFFTNRRTRKDVLNRTDEERKRIINTGFYQLERRRLFWTPVIFMAVYWTLSAIAFGFGTTTLTLLIWIAEITVFWQLCALLSRRIELYLLENLRKSKEYPIGLMGLGS